MLVNHLHNPNNDGEGQNRGVGTFPEFKAGELNSAIAKLA